MSADLDYVKGRIPTYRGYLEENDRYDSDERVRAILGASLTDAHVRLGAGLSEAEETAYGEALFSCMFGDQAFVKRVSHAQLGEEAYAALLAGDRILVELEERVANAATSTEFAALIQEIRTQFAHRSRPEL